MSEVSTVHIMLRMTAAVPNTVTAVCFYSPQCKFHLASAVTQFECDV
jgi:hypothetical protein